MVVPVPRSLRLRAPGFQYDTAIMDYAYRATVECAVRKVSAGNVACDEGDTSVYRP